MFDIGLQEMIVILVVALIVVGPKNLPEIATKLGKGIAQLKRAMGDIKTQVDKEIKAEELAKAYNIPRWDAPAPTEVSSIDPYIPPDRPPDGHSDEQSTKPPHEPSSGQDNVAVNPEADAGKSETAAEEAGVRIEPESKPKPGQGAVGRTDV